MIDANYPITNTYNPSQKDISICNWLIKYKGL